MSDKQGVVFFGPWIGEFGWEIMTWQAWCRAEAKKYEKAYVCSFSDMAPLYQDFAEFVPHDQTGRALDWHKKENIDKVQFDMPPDVTAQILPFKQYRAQGEFIRFGFPIEGYNYLLHARGIKRGGKDYPVDRWFKLAHNLEGTVASIGSSLDHHIPGTADMRGIALNELMDIMAGCDCVIGQSSGVMHLSCLCAPRAVVWGDSRTYFNETLMERYTNTWNPFKTPVKFIFDDNWNPDPDVVVSAASTTIIPVYKTKSDYKRDEFQVQEELPNNLFPRDLNRKMLQAIKTGKYFVTISTIERGKLYHYYKTNDFPKTDMLPSLTHLVNEVKKQEFLDGDKSIKKPQIIDENVPRETGVDTWT